MELNSILKFLENKAILITGGAGFLAKSTQTCIHNYPLFLLPFFGFEVLNMKINIDILNV